MAGVCICSELWRQSHPQDAVSTLSALLQAASYRLRFSAIAPDFILSNAGVSIAFVVVDDVHKELACEAERILKMRGTFQNSYVIVTLSSESDYSVFSEFYFSLGFDGDKPAFIPVPSKHMALEKMIRIAFVHAECKRQGITGMVDLERKQFVQSEDARMACVSSIPKLELHDAHSLVQGVGSLEAISRSSRESIMETTDLSVDSAESVMKLFNDRVYGSTPLL
ncbi:protein PARTING DANCERS [Selaginella moellendorffii]|uniref:protein PARTING DANCERS n=1 Tax=Selaginella moellendorffii TaxID=88036 RepID=UPI000D1C3FE1|nr:protein PARTING DANCERS [Selaginella moellendorffii]|eukprot:XP_024529083.1 protein PARTING DANCERS [Selaginella moellendorffii]